MVKGLLPRPSPFSLVYCYVNWSIFSSLGRLHTMAPFIIWSVLSPYPYEPSQPGHLHWDQQFSDSWLRRPSLRMAVPFEERCPFCCSQADCLPGILARLPTRASGPRSVQGRPSRSRPAPRSKPRAVQGGAAAAVVRPQSQNEGHLSAGPPSARSGDGARKHPERRGASAAANPELPARIPPPRPCCRRRWPGRACPAAAAVPRCLAGDLRPRGPALLSGRFPPRPG